jgi:4-amino-4-deoxy-L-arabinose transferase-like glycosyltransferase
MIWLSLTRQWSKWKRLRPFSGIALLLLIAAPWHVLATLRNPPYFDFTMHSESGSYHGFFWFYFINEHVLRFLNLRYPRDYNTVPRWLFWAFHLLWFFPWSFYAPAAWKLSYRKTDRASRTRLLCLCWAGFILLFFTFSTTQEYYSMPCYPAMAMLLGCAIATEGRWLKAATKVAAGIATLAVAAIAAILWMVRGMAAPGDISNALNSNPDVYTLSLGHMLDLTLASFAYLRLPLAMAGVAFAIGAIAGWRAKGAAVAGFAAMLVLFFHAARVAMVVFDPYLASRPLAEALNRGPEGKLIVDDQYYTFSSVFFYTNRRAYLLNGRVNNLEYGSYAPDAPKDVFISDEDFRRMWTSTDHYYLAIEAPKVERLKRIVDASLFHVKQKSGGKYLFSNF